MEATRVAALRAGDADIAPVSLRARNQVERGGGAHSLGPVRAGYFRIMLMGCWSGGEREGMVSYPCEDKRVRHALAYAIDKSQIQKLFGGPEALEVERGGWNVVTPSTIGWSPDIKPLEFDPDKARALLAEAGYKTPDNPNGKDFGPLIINNLGVSLDGLPPRVGPAGRRDVAEGSWASKPRWSSGRRLP